MLDILDNFTDFMYIFILNMLLYYCCVTVVV